MGRHEEIKQMLESKDIEMVRLGAIIFEKKEARKNWLYILSEFDLYHKLVISRNKIIVIERDDEKNWVWTTSKINSIMSGNMTYSMGTYSYDDRVRDYDQERIEQSRKVEYKYISRNYKSKLKSK